MNRRAFLSLAPATLALQAVADPRRSGHQAVLVAAVPLFHEAANRGVNRAWDSLPETTGMVSVHSWWPDDVKDMPVLDQAIPIGSALLIEREGDPISGMVGQWLHRKVPRIPSVTRLVTMAPSAYSQTRGDLIPASIVISAQRRAAETVIRVPRVWEAQIFRQFSRAPAQADGSRTLEDFDRVGMPMSEIFWRQDELVADLVAGLLPKISRDCVLEDAVARIECRQVEGSLTATRVEMR